MKKVLSAVLVSTLIASSPAVADEAPSKDGKKGHAMLREDRPEDARGWLVLAKSTYWPLCYEALDRLEETRGLIGGSDKDELADAIEKSAAWLGLAASAAMTDGQAGIVSAGNRLGEAADEIRSGSSNLTDSQLNDMITLGEVCMAKSHIIRAGDADRDYKAMRASAASGEKPSKLVEVADREARRDNIERDIEQYRYDLGQSQRHVTVAKTYLETAKESGGLVLTADDLPKVPETAADAKAFQLVDVNDDLRMLTSKMLNSCEQHRKALVAKLDAGK